MPETTDTLAALRGILLAVFVLGALGTAGELLLVGHFKGAWQWLPLALLSASLLVLAGFGVSRVRIALGLFRVLAVIMAASSVVGLILHYRANAEFALESHPDLNAGALMWEAVQGAAPPTLAPGAMILLGLAGLGYTYRHPALERGLNPRPGSPAPGGQAGLPATIEGREG